MNKQRHPGEGHGGGRERAKAEAGDSARGEEGRWGMGGRGKGWVEEGRGIERGRESGSEVFEVMGRRRVRVREAKGKEREGGRKERGRGQEQLTKGIFLKGAPRRRS
mmetsp:Transcript_2203/g.6528  ORF Transcript_2203/g.6528 Transcript_2203/m.6528 type:complete len:107 (-) Transcript_2203:61-381(-)